jgi:hypothetical protein
MRPDLDARWLLCIAFVLLVSGCLLPFLMVVQVLESNLFLNFFAYFMMTLGTMLGFIGITSLVVQRGKRNPLE